MTIARIHHAGRQWSVTTYGLERTDGGVDYAIAKADLLGVHRPWPIHMAEKTGVDIEDFIAMWRLALEHHGVAVPRNVATIVRNAREIARLERTRRERKDDG